MYPLIVVCVGVRLLFTSLTPIVCISVLSQHLNLVIVSLPLISFVPKRNMNFIGMK